MVDMLKLYEIPAAYADLIADLEDNDGEWTPELEARFEALGDNLEQKVERIVAVIRDKETLAQAADSEIERLTKLARSRKRAAAGLKDYLLRNLTTMGLPKMTTRLCEVRVQRNGVPSIKWTGTPEEIPAELRKEVPPPAPELDKERVRALFKADPGQLPAQVLVEYGSHVRIR